MLRHLFDSATSLPWHRALRVHFADQDSMGSMAGPLLVVLVGVRLGFGFGVPHRTPAFSRFRVFGTISAVIIAADKIPLVVPFGAHGSIPRADGNLGHFFRQREYPSPDLRCLTNHVSRTVFKPLFEHLPQPLHIIMRKVWVVVPPSPFSPAAPGYVVRPLQ